ncbi:MAG TPA: hypothetical protein VJ957_12140 [Longimicrobiales bacterium]|nr:hypothetical protein [Longimicrobiales bacterium]
MSKSKRIAAVIAGAGLVVLVGVAAAPQQGPPKLKVDDVASQLGLDAQARKQLAPRIDDLNKVLAQMDEARQQHQRLWTQFQDVEGRIAEQLTPAQQQQFMMVLGRAWGYGPGYGNGPVGPMGYGAMGYGAMGPGAMGPGHMGYGRMGGGWMGRGPMMGGGMMGPGYQGHMRGWMHGRGSVPQDSVPAGRGPRW